MLKLEPAVFAAVRRHGEETYPNECCGVLIGAADAGRDERTVTLAIRCGNMRTDSARNRYSIDPQELIAAQKLARERGQNEDIIGFYHSHPDHPAHWSETDLAEAHWLGCSYVITAVAQGQAAETRSFVLAGTLEEDKRFVSEPVVITRPAATVHAAQSSAKVESKR